MRTGLVAFVVACVLCMSSAQAAWIRVEAGNHLLEANKSGQAVDVMIYGEGKLTDAYVKALVGNGLSGEVPKIEYIDFVEPGALFAVNNDGIDRFFSYEIYGYGGWAENAAFTKMQPPLNEVPTTVDLTPNGQLLARFTIDTTGLTKGQFDFNLGPFELLGIPFMTEFGNRGAFDGTVDIVNGTLTIDVVPEPASIFMMLCGLAGLGLVVVRRKRLA